MSDGGSIIGEVWDRATSSQPAPSLGLVVGTGILALLLVALPLSWRYTRHLVTIAHEAAHGVAALISGRRLEGIRLHSDTSGLTLSRGRRSGPGMVLTAFAGYVGPALLGLGGAYLLWLGHPVGLLWLALLLLALLLIQIRNWFGLWSVLISSVGVFAVSWWGSAVVQSSFAYAGTWFLLLAAPRPVLELQALRRRGQARSSDADMLARLTRIPGIIWVLAFLASAGAALAVGGSWLLRSAG
ncbi:peptidase M50B-like protein [Jatrophihabitans sp. GAS493]|nr:M50 family metallopeptidase [Jatrophihabitans sp. GAS493]SOD74813.1 peptidase M50B-like protein [Jatrophihabitans sp. GAS493]